MPPPCVRAHQIVSPLNDPAAIHLTHLTIAFRPRPSDDNGPTDRRGPADGGISATDLYSLTVTDHASRFVQHSFACFPLLPSLPSHPLRGSGIQPAEMSQQSLFARRQLIELGSQTLCVQRCLRVLLQSEYRLLRQALDLGDGLVGSGGAGAVESKPDAVERNPVLGRPTSQVCIGLRHAAVVHTGALGGLGCLGLCLCHGCHEGDERIADGLLHPGP
jgi:hypothetical protein